MVYPAALTNACVWISIPVLPQRHYLLGLSNAHRCTGLRLNLEQAQWIAHSARKIPTNWRSPKNPTD